MTSQLCEEMRLLIQADLDGELSPADAARVAAHVASCRGCAAVQSELSSLSARVRQSAPRYAAPESLRESVRESMGASLPARISAAGGTGAAGRTGAETFGRASSRWFGWRAGASFGAGFALAACLALAVVLPRQTDLAEAVVADHIRALQPGHLMDVVSTDQHTVKPWFDGRLAFAPPVKELAAEGFPLTGGRLDYLGGREVAALIYRSRRHVIELFVWPTTGEFDRGPSAGSRNGYNFIRWSGGGMAFWAVSDLNAGELADFVRLWRAH